jgi:hypothetical protein
MKKLKIVAISSHNCIRVHKQSLPLLEMGHDVHLIAKKQVGFTEYYRTFSHYSDIGQCIESIKLHSDADIFHCHNEPSWFVCAVKEIFPNKPVVLDVHDTFLTRSTSEEADMALSKGLPHVRVTTEERNSFQLSDALVFVSDDVKQATVGEFNLSQPSIVLPSYVPYGLYQYHTKEWMGGLVYEGRVTLPEEHQGLNLNTGANYCDYEEVAREAKKTGIDFHLYAGREDEPFKKAYEEEAFIHPGYDYKNLLRQISRHDWGLVGNSINGPQWNMTLPNKLFDYMASGVPSVCINASASAKLVGEYGIGMEVSSLEELAKRWGEHRQYRNNIWKRRKELSMEANIGRLLRLYGDLI